MIMKQTKMIELRCIVCLVIFIVFVIWLGYQKKITEGFEELKICEPVEDTLINIIAHKGDSDKIDKIVTFDSNTIKLSKKVTRLSQWKLQPHDSTRNVYYILNKLTNNHLEDANGELKCYKHDKGGWQEWKLEKESENEFYRIRSYHGNYLKWSGSDVLLSNNKNDSNNFKWDIKKTEELVPELEIYYRQVVNNTYTSSHQHRVTDEHNNTERGKYKKDDVWTKHDLNFCFYAYPFKIPNSENMIKLTSSYLMNTTGHQRGRIFGPNETNHYPWTKITEFWVYTTDEGVEKKITVNNNKYTLTQYYVLENQKRTSRAKGQDITETFIEKENKTTFMNDGNLTEVNIHNGSNRFWAYSIEGDKCINPPEPDSVLDVGGARRRGAGVVDIRDNPVDMSHYLNIDVAFQAPSRQYITDANNNVLELVDTVNKKILWNIKGEDKKYIIQNENHTIHANANDNVSLISNGYTASLQTKWEFIPGEEGVCNSFYIREASSEKYLKLDFSLSVNKTEWKIIKMMTVSPPVPPPEETCKPFTKPLEDKLITVQTQLSEKECKLSNKEEELNNGRRRAVELQQASENQQCEWDFTGNVPVIVNNKVRRWDEQGHLLKTDDSGISSYYHLLNLKENEQAKCSITLNENGLTGSGCSITSLASLQNSGQEEIIEEINTKLNEIIGKDNEEFIRWFYSHRRTLLLYYVFVYHPTFLKDKQEEINILFEKISELRDWNTNVKRGFIEKNVYLKEDMKYIIKRFESNENISSENIKYFINSWKENILNNLNDEEKIQMIETGNIQRIIDYFETTDEPWYNGMLILNENYEGRLSSISSDIQDVYNTRKDKIKEKSDEMEMIAGNKKRMAELKGDRDDILNKLYDKMLYVYLFLLFLCVAVYVDSRMDKIILSNGSYNWRFIIVVIIFTSLMVIIPWRWTEVMIWLGRGYDVMKREVSKVKNVYM